MTRGASGIAKTGVHSCMLSAAAPSFSPFQSVQQSPLFLVWFFPNVFAIFHSNAWTVLNFRVKAAPPLFPQGVGGKGQLFFS